MGLAWVNIRKDAPNLCRPGAQGDNLGRVSLPQHGCELPLPPDASCTACPASSQVAHSRNTCPTDVQTTLDLYTDEDLDEMIAAQEKFLDAVGFDREPVQ